MAKGMKTEHGYVERVDLYDEGGFSIKKNDGWSFWVTAEEAAKVDYVPKMGDSVAITMYGFNDIAGIKIGGHTFRNNSVKDMEWKRIQWKADYNIKRHQRVLDNYDKWQAEVETLHPVLQKRIRRFENKTEPYDFWAEDGGYELAILSGATALIRWATGPDRPEDMTPDEALVWWWSLNSKEHDYDYKRQMEIVPDFGDGHSGNTAGAAYSLARGIITGSYSE